MPDGFILQAVMNEKSVDKFLVSLDLAGQDDRIRAIAFLSALIAYCRPGLLRAAYINLKNRRFDQKAVYETILQSYLFLGFPRMIEAAIAFSETGGTVDKFHEADFEKISTLESEQWFEKGVNLCKKVYGENYRKLEKRFMQISPEMFRWMVIEGYGKVLTRPGLSSIERELAEVAALIVDARERQLLSHIIGSLNVGASLRFIKQINEDIRPLAGQDGYNLAKKTIALVELKYDSPK